MRLEDIDVSRPELFRRNTMWPYFERLRKEDPVHYCPRSRVGPYWSVTKYKDIMHVETNHAVFSSDIDLGGIGIRDAKPDYRAKASSPWTSRGTARSARPWRRCSCRKISTSWRTRSAKRSRDPRQPAAQRDVRLGRSGLDRADHADAGDAVRLSLGGPPQADALVRRRDRARRAIAGSSPRKRRARPNCWNARAYFEKLWKERIKQPPKSDLLSMMAHSEATRDMDPKNFLGNLILLIVGGNDTTRNSLSGSIYALNQHPGPVQEAARKSCAGPKARARGDPLADAARPHAPDRARPTPRSPARRSRRAKRS